MCAKMSRVNKALYSSKLKAYEAKKERKNELQKVPKVLPRIISLDPNSKIKVK
jgi:hypothetical protein